MASWQDDPIAQPQQRQAAPWESDPVANVAVDVKPFAQRAQNALAKAAEPITSYPSTYGQMNREARGQMAQGVEQIGQGGLYNTAVGAGKTALGAAGYLTSPINAALRTFVGKPVEENTGIPKEYPEFAAGLMLPVPKNIPLAAVSRAARGAKAGITTEDAFNAADKGYEAARGSQFVAPSNEVSALANDARTALTDQGYRDYLAPKTFRALQEFKTEGPSNVADIEGVRRALNKAAADPSERDAARRAINTIDDYLTPRVPQLAEARANYAAGSRSEEIDTALEKASRQAGSAHSGGNIENATRQQIKAIINSPSRSRGFSANELAQMEDIVKGGAVPNALRTAGSLLGHGGGLKTLVAGLASGGVAPLFGYGLSKLGHVMTAREVGALQEMVLSRAPAAKAVSASLRDWSTATHAFEVDPSIRAYARVTIASRNLANNLQVGGMSVPVDKLLRAVHGAVKGRSNPEQPEPQRVINDHPNGNQP